METNKFFRRVIRAIKNPYRILILIVRSSPVIYKHVSDKVFIEWLYRAVFQKKIDWDTPQTINEKLQWIKLYDHNPQYTKMVDKYAAKQYVADMIGEQYVIPTLGVWNHFDEIDFDQLPNQFVLKCTHDSGSVVICKDKSKLDKKTAKEKIEKSLKSNYYWLGREWPYKNVPPRIIAEQYMQDDELSDCKPLNYEFGLMEKTEKGLTDYKFYCFNGKAKIVMIASNRFSAKQTTFDYYDRKFNHLPFQWGNPSSNVLQKKPNRLDEMFAIAEHLANNIPEVRVDLYLTNNHIYFGEFTFFDGSGFDLIEPNEWDYKIGELLQLPLKR
jgi:hypothetical protein